jgi:hypothetical protein
MDTVLKAENVVPLPVNLVGKDIRAPLDKNDFRCDELLQALPAAVYTTDAAELHFTTRRRPHSGVVARSSARVSGAARGDCIGRMADRCRMANAPWP